MGLRLQGPRRCQGATREGVGQMGATQADIDAAWLKVEAYLAARGIHMAANSDPTDPVFRAQVDALQQSDPELSRLLMALTCPPR